MSRGELVVVMLNPSTADEMQDDATIRRVLGFAKRDGYSSIRVVNLFALRATNPYELHAAEDAVGPDNDRVLRNILNPGHGAPVLAAWGASSLAKARASKVLSFVYPGMWLCLGTTKDGSPRHPLYIKGDQPMIPFKFVGVDNV